MDKKDRELEIFYRLLTGAGVSVAELANEYQVSTKSISRDINDIKNFIADHRGILANAEIKYSASSRKYFMELPRFFSPSELFAVVKILIGSRGLSKNETLELISKLKQFTTKQDQATIDELIKKEMYHFTEVKHDCNSVVDNLWKLTECIRKHSEITISYYKMSREYVERRIRPIAITFSDYYFYIIGYQQEKDDNWEIRYYRVDRIVRITEHRIKFDVSDTEKFDEGDLMCKIQLMFPGRTRKIRFEFSGPSVQAILDKIPTAKLIEKKNGASIIEAEVFGSGVNMFLLSQGAWIKALAPKEFVDEMTAEIEKMMARYK